MLRARGLSARTQFLSLDVWDEPSYTTPPLVSAVQMAGQALEIPVTRQGRDPSSDATRMLAYGIPSVTIDPQGFLRGAKVAIASAWLLASAGQ